MSLILEALRKSEAERRRGSAPDLARELPPVAPPVPGAQRTWWLACGAVVAVVLALLAWSLQPAPHVAGRQGGADGAPGTDASRASGDGARAAAPVGGAAAWPDVVRIAPSALSASAGSDDAATLEAVAAAAAAAAIDVDDADDHAAALGPGANKMESPPRAVSPPVVATAIPPQRAGDAPTAASPTRVPAPAAAATTRPAGGATPDPDEDRRVAATPEARSTTASDPTAGGDVARGSGSASAASTGELRLSALSPDARARLPALKLTMHLWNEEPARRFVILDGVRLGVGDRVGAGTVAAVDSDGVVIALDGQRVRLPLR